MLQPQLKTKLSLVALLIASSMLTACGDSTTNIVEKDPIAVDDDHDDDHDHGRPMPETGIKARQQALVPLGSETHGGEDVALFATGPSANRVRGVIEQNVIYAIIRKALGWAE